MQTKRKRIDNHNDDDDQNRRIPYTLANIKQNYETLFAFLSFHFCIKQASRNPENRLWTYSDCEIKILSKLDMNGASRKIKKEIEND